MITTPEPENSGNNSIIPTLPVRVGLENSDEP